MSAAGYVYFIRREVFQGSYRYKIGFSSQPKVRLKGLQTAADTDLELLGAVAGSLKLERQIHHALRWYRTSGEWFEECGPVVRFIDDALNYGITGALADITRKSLEREWDDTFRYDYRRGTYTRRDRTRMVKLDKQGLLPHFLRDELMRK